VSAVMTETADRKSARKPSSGSANRQRTAQVLLRLLPTEREQLERRAAELGFTGTGNVTAYLRHVLDLDQAV